MNFQILENICRVCNVVNNISDSYQIYYNEDLSPWEKVCRITPRLFGFAADSALLASPACSSIKSADLNKLRVVSVTSNTTGFVSDITFSKEPISYRNAANMAINAVQIIDQTGIIPISGKALSLGAEGISLAISLQELVSKKESIKKVILTFVKNLDVPNYEQRLEQAITQLVEHLKNTKEKNWLHYMQNIVNDCEKILNNEPAIVFKHIPYVFLNRKEFQRRRCMISNQPICKVVVIKETTTSSPIYYDRINLSLWDAFNDGSPPSWPKSIPFTYHAIIVDEIETAQIIKAFQITLDNIQNDLTEQENIRIALIATQTLLKSTGQSSTSK